MAGRQPMTGAGAVWGRGRYETVARHLAPLSDVLLDEVEPALGSLRGCRLLDVGSGTGNLALAAAARGARVTALDPASRLLDAAAARARAQGVEVETVTAEAEAMPLPDGAFDAVVSCLGVVFAADPEAAAAEMRRVARSTGVLGVLAWCPAEPGDPFAAPIRDAVPPPPPGRPLPTDWGVPEDVERLLGRRRAVRLRPGGHEWRLADVEEAVRLLDDSPLHVSVTGSLDPAGRERFRSVAREAFTALAPGGRPVVRTPYLVAVAVPPRGPSPVPRERESHGRPEAPDVPEQHPSSPLPLAGGADGPRHDHRRRP